MRIQSRRIGRFKGDHVSHVSVDDVIGWLSDDPNPETVAQLYDFGKLLLDQVCGLRESYNAKLASCLGWSSALLAVVLLAAREWAFSGVAGRFAFLGAVGALVGVTVSSFGLRSVGGWKWPSEQDWFASDYLKWPDRLRIQHLIAMLEAHQSYSERVHNTGWMLACAEYSLGFAGLMIGIAALVKQLS